ncbi:MAG: hypothetical protein ACRES8_05925 [Nevskiaceae bacterium]
MSAATILTSVFAQGGRTSRYGEFTVVFMHGCSFITTPMEFMQMQNWARGRGSCGNAPRDRSAFTDRFETMLARIGSGLNTRGNRPLLSRMVKAMKANGLLLEEWNIPHDVHDSVEMSKPKRAPGPPGPRAAQPAANDTSADGVAPLPAK